MSSKVAYMDVDNVGIRVSPLYLVDNVCILKSLCYNHIYDIHF